MQRRIFAGLVAAFAIAALVPAAASAQATIHPGVQTFTQGAQCTANFIFQGGGSTYIGQAAHCSGTGAATETNGCDSASLPIGTPVEITGASQPGTLAYNSWITMQQAGETNPDACAYNDIALVRIAAADVGKVSASVPGFGGPTGVGGASSTGATVYSYGNSSLRAGITQLSPKQGVVVQTTGNGWSRTVYTVTPGIPGDSGSGFLDAQGKAIGVLSTVAIAPLPASNGVGDLGRELSYAASHGTSVSLVNGGPFNGNVVGAILGS
jgi:hypothetical protein